MLPLDGYRRPTARMKSYVTLWHPSTGSGYGRRVYIEMLIRRGRQDLQAVAQHINEKIEILLEASRSSDEAPSVRFSCMASTLASCNLACLLTLLHPTTL